MKTVGERIKYVIEKEGLSVLSFATENNINYSGLTQIINNKRSLGMEVLHQLKAALPKINTEWLLFGDSNFENVSHYVNIENPKALQESAEKYMFNDPVKEMFLQYMKDPDVQNMIRQIMK